MRQAVFWSVKFPSVGETVRWFVEKRSLFSFAGYFWRQKPDTFKPGTVFPTEEEVAEPWIQLALWLNTQVDQLDDRFPRPSWQGLNSRVCVVYEGDAGTDGKPDEVVRTSTTADLASARSWSPLTRAERRLPRRARPCFKN